MLLKENQQLLEAGQEMTQGTCQMETQCLQIMTLIMCLLNMVEDGPQNISQLLLTKRKYILVPTIVLSPVHAHFIM